MPLPHKLFCDTSFFYACCDPSDVNHRRAAALVRELAVSPSELAATWDIIGETVTLLSYRRSHREAVRFLDEVKPRLRIVDYGGRVRTVAEEVFRRRGRGRRLSFCDAVSFVVVTTLLDHRPCLAFDRDFRALGLTVVG
jgi:predicted nucleic acid-binding protein